MTGYNFTTGVRRVLQDAPCEAERLASPCITSEHILLALSLPETPSFEQLAEDLAIPLESMAAVRSGVEQRLRTMPFAPAPDSDLPYTPGARRIIERAMTEARELSHEAIQPEHLLLAYLGGTEGVASQDLATIGLTLDRARPWVAARYAL